MMAPGVLHERRRALDFLLRALIVIAVFAIVGPPIGGILMMLILIVPTLVDGQRTVTLSEILGGMAFGALLSYFLAATPAAIVGAVIAILDTLRGRVSFFLAICIGSVVVVAWLSFQELVSFVRYGNDAHSDGSFFNNAFFACSLLATAACWKLTRRGMRP
jgi:hypothetical protein